MLLSVHGCTSDPIVATIGSAKILNSEFNYYFNYYAAYYGVDDPTSQEDAETVTYLRDYVLNALIKREILYQKAMAMGLDSLSDEMKAEIDKEVADSMAGILGDFIEQAQTSNPELSGNALEAKAKALMTDYMKRIGSSEAKLRVDSTRDYIINRLVDESTKDVTLSEQTLRDTYESRVEELKDIYADDAAIFEQDFFEGITLYYIPAGYRRVKHILIGLPEETIMRIIDLRHSGDAAAADKLRNDALADILSRAQEVHKQILPDASNFDTLMQTVSDDTASLSIPSGYAVCKAGQFTKEFIDASFAIKKPLTFSGLIPGDYGYHIVLYIETLKEGPVPFESVRVELETELLAMERDGAFAELAEGWIEQAESTITRYTDRIVYIKPKSTPAATPAS